MDGEELCWEGEGKVNTASEAPLGGESGSTVGAGESPGATSAETGADEAPEEDAVGTSPASSPNAGSGAGGALAGLGRGAFLGQLVSDGETPNLFLQRFRLKPGHHTHAGRMVAVKAVDASDRDIIILARVNNVREQNPHEDAQSSTVREVLPFGSAYPPEGVSTVIWRIAEIEPLEEAVLHGNAVADVKHVETLPPAGSPVFEADSDLVQKALGLEPDPGKGLEIGSLYGDPRTSIVLSRGAVQRGMLIVGGIGSGKSYTRGVLAEELWSHGVPQVNLDINGEMREAAQQLGGVNLTPGRGFTLPVSALSPADVLEAVPSINRGTNMETLLRFAHEMLLKDLMNGRLTKGYFDVDDLLQAIDPAAKRLGFEKNAAQTVEPTRIRTETLKRHPYLGAPFDWPKALKPGAFVNIDCRGLFISDLRLITASIARDIQGLARARKIPFVAFSIDEAHLVAPNNDDTVTTQVLREVARIGRHLRLGIILTTQSPQDVDRSVLKRLLTRFLHAIEPDQLDALKGVFSDASDELVRQLPKLPQGVCVLTGAFETVRHATVIRIRQRRTLHGGATPDIFADLGKRGWSEKRSVEEQLSSKPEREDEGGEQ